MNNNFNENIKGEMSWMTADNLSAFTQIIHAFSTRRGGVSRGIYSSLNLGFGRGDAPELVSENYRLLCSALGISEQSIVSAKQIHSDMVRKVGAADKKQRLDEPTAYEADALITAERGISLAVFAADCIPILFFAPDSLAIAAAHAGWRGTVADIAGKTTRALCSEYGGKTENLQVAIGAGIGRCCFETGAEVYQAVAALGLECEAEALAVDDGNGKFHIDLKEVNRRLLIRAGVPQENIAVNSECTRCLCDKYWSHRATNGQRGVQAAIIALK